MQIYTRKWYNSNIRNGEDQLITSLFFILLLIYAIGSGDGAGAFKLGCLWLLVCLVAEMLLWTLIFGGIFAATLLF